MRRMILLATAALVLDPGSTASARSVSASLRPSMPSAGSRLHVAIPCAQG